MLSLGVLLGRGLLLVAVSVLLTGCQTLGGYFQSDGLGRAAFDLECPKESLEYAGLNAELGDFARLGQQIGVRGCGKRAVYVLSQSGWILNGSSAPPPSP